MLQRYGEGAAVARGLPDFTEPKENMHTTQRYGALALAALLAACGGGEQAAPDLGGRATPLAAATGEGPAANALADTVLQHNHAPIETAHRTMRPVSGAFVSRARRS